MYKMGIENSKETIKNIKKVVPKYLGVYLRNFSGAK